MIPPSRNNVSVAGSRLTCMCHIHQAGISSVECDCLHECFLFTSFSFTPNTTPYALTPCIRIHAPRARTQPRSLSEYDAARLQEPNVSHCSAPARRCFALEQARVVTIYQRASRPSTPPDIGEDLIGSKGTRFRSQHQHIRSSDIPSTSEDISSRLILISLSCCLTRPRFPNFYSNSRVCFPLVCSQSETSHIILWSKSGSRSS